MSLPPYSSSSSSSSPAASPSKVVHFRNVGSNISQSDLVDTCLAFGPIANVLMLKAANQALVQFQELTGAMALVDAVAKTGITVRGTTVYPQYSNHSEITVSTKQPPAGIQPSRILHVTILNPFYAITVDVLSEVFSRYDTSGRGTVEKIVIFQKVQNLQALVQFSSVENAVAAKNAVDGKNIYSNCCTLQIKFSNLSDLTIKENSERSRDFTNPTLPEKASTDALLTTTARQSRGSVGLMDHSMPGRMATTPQSVMGVMGGDRCVLLVSGFPPERVSCEQLFNLFSNYGVITRIKILHNKPNMALIQFAESIHAQQAMNYLRNARLFGSSLEINYSKFQAIHLPPSRAGAPTDGKTVDYESSTLNRFMRYHSSNLKNMTQPTDILHVSSLAPGTTVDVLKQHMSKTSEPQQVKIYEFKGKQMALVQFQSPESACDAMCLLHNSTLGGQRIKLSFTRNHI